ncbi:MAG: class I adenylate-forming enzyme family protein [Pseudomonadota bacterium]
MTNLENHRIEVSTVGDFLLQRVDRFGDRNLLIFPQERVSYKDFAIDALTYAKSLRAHGIGSGDAVGILMPNCMAYLKLLVAANFLGAVAVPMNARYKPPELAYVVENADLKLICTTDQISEYADFAQLLETAFPDIAGSTGSLSLRGAPQLQHVVLFGQPRAGFVNGEEFVAAGSQIALDEIHHARVRVRVDQPAIMMYTSGTTAEPKGCPLSHALLVRNGINMNRERYFLDENDVFWAPLPMFHMSSILPFLCCIDAGAAMASMLHVDAGAALAMMESERVTVAFPSFPTVTNDLINHERFASTDLSALRRINNVAPIEVLRRFAKAFPQAVQTGAYGLTEAGGVICFNHPDESEEERLYTCGKPFPGIEVQITDPERKVAQPLGERGEMWIKGYSVFDGYHKSPEKNAESFSGEWFRTGDLCSVTETGAVCYHGRIKDMLKVGGENVAALEIESHLATHPAIALAQVIGRPDERLLEVPIAFVELNQGAQVNANEIIEFCRAALASFKVPRAVHFVTEWPMSSTKIQKFKLVEPD